MKYINKALILIIIIILIFGCTPFFITSNFDIVTADHSTIAILPFHMTYTGLIPEELAEDDYIIIEEGESKAFMISYFNEILRSTKSGKKPIRINLQHYTNTLNILEENEISIMDSWDLNSEKLADLLGVDAVVRGSIQKNQLIHDLTSYGIEVGLHVINILTDHSLFPWIPFNATKSKEVDASYDLINGKDGSILWSISYEVEADWRQTANDIIDSINRRSSKKFPYRVK
ncbi:hypothetical protein ACFL46_05850 [Candidatus Neomarinimicrobiota bacterium]